jgi:hypothetical protein
MDRKRNGFKVLLDDCLAVAAEVLANEEPKKTSYEF